MIDTAQAKGRDETKFGAAARVALVVITGLLSAGPLCANVNEFRLIFPQAVRGTAGFYFETRIVVTNPGAEPVEVALESEQFEFEGENAAFELGPRESRVIVLSGEPIQVGAVRLTASEPVAGSAFILSKKSQEAEEVLSEVTVIGAPPTAKAVLPVFVNSLLAEDTGIAVHYQGVGPLRFALNDLEGQEVASRQEEPPFDPKDPSSSSSQAAFFVTELFADLPAGFSQGSLVVQDLSDASDTFGLVALYTRGARFWAAEVAAIDDLRGYFVKVKPTDDLEETAAMLSQTYGFEITHVIDPHLIAIEATREVARAVSRDPKVEVVYKTTVPVLSPGQ